MVFEGEKVIMFHGVVDLRKGVTGLLSLLEKPERGTWYLFSNRTRGLIKCLRIDETGNWLVSRRLSRGHFQWIERATASSRISAADAHLICSGGRVKRQILQSIDL